MIIKKEEILITNQEKSDEMGLIKKVTSGLKKKLLIVMYWYSRYIFPFREYNFYWRIIGLFIS